jgi:hypothetical protein
MFNLESDLLESVQKEAGRIITGLRCNSSRQNLFRELGWEILENRRNKLLKIFKLGDSVIARGKVFHILLVKGIKLS